MHLLRTDGGPKNGFLSRWPARSLCLGSSIDFKANLGDAALAVRLEGSSASLEI